MLKKLAKFVVRMVALVVATPAALFAGFGRWEVAFQFFAQSLSVVPGLPGDYLRAAYYTLTLKQCSMSCRISFGSFFAQSATWIGPGVYVGAYCVIGASRIGDRTQIASHVQILSGARQHERGADGQILSCESDALQPVSIGADCWIGASAIVMADVGEGTTIGAGAVVTKPIPAGAVAFGNPARVRDDMPPTSGQAVRA